MSKSWKCDSNYFLDALDNKCYQCDNSCNGICFGYSNEKCLQCNESFKFRNLETMDCVQKCPNSTISVELTDQRFNTGMLKYCRSPVFYVDGNTQQNIELGTKQFPFRMLDDPIRESFQNFPGNPNYKGTTWLLFNQQYRPYENGDTNETHSTITIYDRSYYRNNTVFNPTLYSNSTPFAYNYQKQIDQGLMTVGEVTNVKFKFIIINSGIEMSNITFIEKYSVKYDQLNALFVGHFVPYKWVNVTNCKFYLFQILMISNKGFNSRFDSSFFDISQMQYLNFIIANPDCNANLIPEMSNKQIWNNNYFTGYNIYGRFPIIIASQAQNLTFTNNQLIDIKWAFNQEGTIFANGREPDCPPEQRLDFLVHIENNTISNKDPTIKSNVAFNGGFITLFPELYWTAIFRNNSFINQTYGSIKQGIVLFQKQPYSKNLNVTIENNYFENCYTDYQEQNLFFSKAEYGIFRNNKFINTSSANVVSLEFTNGLVENITFVNSSSRPNSLNKDTSLLKIQNSTNLVIDNIKYQSCNFGNNKALYILESQNLSISNVVVEYTISGNEVEGGSIFQLDHNSKEFNINNCTFKDNSGSFASLTPVEVLDPLNPQQIYIRQSNFSRNFGNMQGLFYITKNANLTVTDSIFKENYSLGSGSIIFGEQKSSNSTGGVIYVESEGSAKIINSTIYNNHAIEGSIIYVINSQNQITFSKGLIKENGFNTQDEQLLNSFLNLQLLIKNNQSKSDGYADMQNVTITDSQVNVLSLTDSYVKIKNFQANNLITNSDSSLFSFNTFSLTNISCYEKPVMILVQSQLMGLAVHASEFNQTLLRLEETNFACEQCEIKNAVNLKTMGLVIKSKQSTIQFSNSQVDNINALSGAFIYTLDDKKNQDEQVQVSIESSTLKNLSAIGNGGAVYVSNQQLSIKNTIFQNNQANMRGGSVYIACDITSAYCNTNLTGNSFVMSKALVSGGGIYYELNQPLKLIRQTYSENEAPYGQNYASYPTKLKLINQDTNFLHSLVSGQTLEIDILIGLFDQNDQLISKDSESMAQISSNDLAVSISGNTKVIANNGVFTFNLINFFAKPDYLSKIQFSTESIDISKSSLSNLIQSQLEVIIKFRDCLSGEVNLNNKCHACQKGIYSFGSKQIQCKNCPRFLQCQGGDVTLVDPGYWRSFNQSTYAFKCLNKNACLQINISLNLYRGGQDSQCAEGYQGLLCSKCTGISNDTIYGSTGLGDCSKCKSLAVQFLAFFGICLLILIYISYLSYSLIHNPKRNNPQAVMIRILTNYIQAVLLAKQFNLRWPQNVEDMLTYFSFISSSQETLLSFDCILLQLGYQSVSQNELKLLLFGTLPIILSFIGTFVWAMIKITIKRNDKNFSFLEKIEITAMIVNYLCYPQIITIMFSLFDCYNLDNDISYLKRDMDITCWTNYHNKLIVSIGLPFIFVWTLIVPILLIKKIHGARKNLDDNRILKIYGLYYIGLKDEVFYWELIISNLRKLLFITCSTILATQKAQFRGYLGLIVLFVNNQLSNRFMPFIDSKMNTIEYHATFSSSLGLFLHKDHHREKLIKIQKIHLHKELEDIQEN
eukprot:403376514